MLADMEPRFGAELSRIGVCLERCAAKSLVKCWNPTVKLVPWKSNATVARAAEKRVPKTKEEQGNRVTLGQARLSANSSKAMRDDVLLMLLRLKARTKHTSGLSTTRNDYLLHIEC
jgi:hypothetical protein